MHISKEEKSALAAMLIEDPEEASGLSDEVLANAARAADATGFDARRFLHKLSVVDGCDRILECVVPIWCKSGRKAQLRDAFLKLPAGTFLARNLVSVMDQPDDLDFLVATGRETYRMNGIFLELDQVFLDQLWTARVNKFLGRPDYRRAYQEIRAAIRGFTPSPSSERTFESSRHEEGGVSNQTAAILISHLHRAIVSEGILPPLSAGALREPALQYGEYSYTRKSKKGQITITANDQVPAWDLACALFARGECGPAPAKLWEAGHQLLALAKHFSQAKWR